MNLFFCSALVFIANWTSFFFGLDKPSFDFHPPVKIDMVLAANFGELRSNHFHMGIDIKTEGRIGTPLYSIDEGFVSRIKISPYGYGKVIYVDHPGGITSVYAHCSDFPEKIKSQIEKIQRQNKSSEIDWYPAPQELPVARGEKIALSGNTGHSFGPHLHFELRDTHTEEALNPLKYGFKIKDTQAPNINRVKAYALNADGEIISPLQEFKVSGSSLGNIKLEVPKNTSHIGWAVDVWDPYEGSYNKLGVYEVRMKMSEQIIFGSTLEKVGFDETRYINSYSDVCTPYRRNYHKCFTNSFTELRTYIDREHTGRMYVKDDLMEVQIECIDVNGNSSRVNISFEVEKSLPAQEFSTSSVSPDSSFSLQSSAGELIVEAPLSYQRIPVNIEWLKNGLRFDHSPWPMHNSCLLYLNASPAIDIEKQYVLYQGKDSKSAIWTNRENGKLDVSFKNFGIYTLAVDSISPTIEWRRKSLSISKTSHHISWRINDKDSGVKEYHVYVNGVWQPTYLERKGNWMQLETRFLSEGENQVEVVVKDQCENIKKAEYAIRLY